MSNIFVKLSRLFCFVIPLNSFSRYVMNSCRPMWSLRSSIKLKLQRSTRSRVGIGTLHRNTTVRIYCIQIQLKAYFHVLCVFFLTVLCSWSSEPCHPRSMGYWGDSLALWDHGSGTARCILETYTFTHIENIIALLQQIIRVNGL